MLLMSESLAADLVTIHYDVLRVTILDQVQNLHVSDDPVCYHVCMDMAGGMSPSTPQHVPQTF